MPAPPVVFRALSKNLPEKPGTNHKIFGKSVRSNKKTCFLTASCRDALLSLFFRSIQKNENIAVNTLAAKISGQTGKRKKGLFFPYGDSAPRIKMPLSRHALFFLSLCGA